MVNRIDPSEPGGSFQPPNRGGRGRQPGGFGFGPGGSCVCPECGTKAPYQRGVPCYRQSCPKCGQPMTRG